MINQGNYKEGGQEVQSRTRHKEGSFRIKQEIKQNSFFSGERGVLDLNSFSCFINVFIYLMIITDLFCKAPCNFLLYLLSWLIHLFILEFICTPYLILKSALHIKLRL